MRREQGFTLVELLVVMLILSMLAAVAIPSFFLQRDKAGDAEAKAAVRVAQTAAEAIATDNDGAYDGPLGISVANLIATEPTLSGAALSVPSASADSFTVRVHSSTGNSFDITRNSTGTTDLTCATAGTGGCPADGTWGD